MWPWLSSTSALYITRRFLLWMAIVVATVSGLSTCIDAIELTKRAYHTSIPSDDFLMILFSKLPYQLTEMLPFGGLIGSMLCFQQLSRSHEWVAMQNAGISPKQGITPALLAASIIGVIAITIINPISTVLLAQSERLQERYIKAPINTLAVSPSGIWFKDTDPSGQYRRLVHAGRIDSQRRMLGDVLILHFHMDNDFAERIQAKRAILDAGKWQLEGVTITTRAAHAETYAHYMLETDTVIAQLQENVGAPESLSFWELPPFITSLKHSGFSALRHTVYWYGLMAFPFFITSLVLIGACFAIHLPRIHRGNRLFLFGLLFGFLVYFGTKLVHALGFSGSIWPFFAAWSPTIICLLAGIALLLHWEEV